MKALPGSAFAFGCWRGSFSAVHAIRLCSRGWKVRVSMHGPLAGWLSQPFASAPTERLIVATTGQRWIDGAEP